VNNQIFIAIFRFIYLDKMIAASERSERTVHAAEIAQLTFAKQLIGKRLAVRVFLVVIAACGYLVFDKIVKGGVVDFYITEINRKHTAADVHADDVRYYFIGHSRGKTHNATRTRVCVGHNAHFCTLKRRFCYHFVYLVDCRRLYKVGENF